MTTSRDDANRSSASHCCSASSASPVNARTDSADGIWERSAWSSAGRRSKTTVDGAWPPTWRASQGVRYSGRAESAYGATASSVVSGAAGSVSTGSQVSANRDLSTAASPTADATAESGRHVSDSTTATGTPAEVASSTRVLSPSIHRQWTRRVGVAAGADRGMVRSPSGAATETPDQWNGTDIWRAPPAANNGCSAASNNAG